ncbi:MAG: tRNA pseudouridine(38-40) synthase TruA [Deltaproteobacteria bacterium]|nr:tRNA pseudouridine(38-40) synthase TruA [Deltaproteobacteria bacterium]
MPRNLKLTLEYEGTAYHGWQVQPNGFTIQEVVECVLERLTGVRPKVIASGRTDAGVHAEGQVAHFHADCPISCGKFRKGLNALLPDDIVVREVEEVPLEFHARFSAVGKTYRYVILNRSFPSVFERNRCWLINRPLDTAAMETAGRCLVGRHDFSSFRASDCCAKHPVREIHRLDVVREDDWIRLFISADAFLQHMVRNIVGTLVEVGRGKIPPEKVKEILDARDRRKAGPTAPPGGLFLQSVEYGEGLRRRRGKGEDGAAQDSRCR